MSVCKYAHFFMTLSENLDCTLQHSLPSLSHFSEFIDFNWIEESLHQTGKASIRRRKLPAEHVVWLVIGLALFRNQPAYNILRRQMKYMAQHVKVSPLRMSFHITSIAILNLLKFDSLASAGNLPKHLESLMEKSKRYVLPKKRSRNYPRVVKGKP